MKYYYGIIAIIKMMKIQPMKFLKKTLLQKERIREYSNTVGIVSVGIIFLLLACHSISLEFYKNSSIPYSNKVILEHKIDSLETILDSINTVIDVYKANKVSKSSFMTKSIEDGIDEALIYYDIKYPDIVKAQALLETGNYTSNLCVNHNNLFGLYDSKNKRYYSYKHWYESIEDYKRLIQSKYDNNKYYYEFLEDIKYASDKKYVSKLKEIVKEMNNK